MEGAPVERVSHFPYLGSVVLADGTLDKELNTRIGKAYGAFTSLHKIWYNRNIQTSTKIRIYKAAVLTVLVYGSEAWTTTQSQDKRVEAFHQRCLRRILRIQWYRRISNEEVLERAGIEGIAAFVGSNRLRWFGHLIRMPAERTPNRLYKWQPTHGRRSRGRPRTTWSSCILNDFRDVTGGAQSLRAVTELAVDRKEWRRQMALIYTPLGSN